MLVPLPRRHLASDGVILGAAAAAAAASQSVPAGYPRGELATVSGSAATRRACIVARTHARVARARAYMLASETGPISRSHRDFSVTLSSRVSPPRLALERRRMSSSSATVTLASRVCRLGMASCSASDGSRTRCGGSLLICHHEWRCFSCPGTNLRKKVEVSATLLLLRSLTSPF